MYSPDWNVCHSSCFCNCYHHYLSQSNNYTYQINAQNIEKNETAQFKHSYLNGYEGDTMTSLSEKWKYSQLLPLDQYCNDNLNNKDMQKTITPNQNDYYFETFQPQKYNYQLENINEYKQPLIKPNIDYSIKENEKLIKIQSNNPIEEIQNNSTGVFYDDNNYYRNDMNKTMHKEIVYEALDFVQFVAKKEGVNYIEDNFYIENIDSFRQLLHALKKRMEDKIVISNLNKDEKTTNQVNSITNNNSLIEKNKHQVNHYSQKQFETTQKPNIQFKQNLKNDQKNRESSFENKIMEVKQIDIENKQINPEHKPKTQLKQQVSSEKKLNNINQPFSKNQIQPQQFNEHLSQNKKIIEQNQLSKVPKSIINLTKFDQENNLNNSNHILKQNNIKQYPSQQKSKKIKYNNSIQQEKIINHQMNVRLRSQDNKNVNLPRNDDINNNSLKEHLQQQNSIPKIRLTNNKSNNFPKNLFNSFSHNNLFPIYNNYNEKLTQKKKHVFQRPNSQMSSFNKTQNNEIADYNFKLSLNKNDSSSRDCLACNVQCNISTTGYSPMTYSPYGDRKRRRSITPIKSY